MTIKTNIYKILELDLPEPQLIELIKSAVSHREYEIKVYLEKLYVEIFPNNNGY